MTGKSTSLVRITCLLILFLLVSQTLFPQRRASRNITLSGTVVDEQGTAMPFVAIQVTDSSEPEQQVGGAVADKDGKFSFSLPKEGQYTLRASYLGYTAQTVPVTAERGKELIANIKMTQSSVALDSIVVKSPLTITSDKIVYDFENDPDRATSNMTTMIHRMPLISTDGEGKIVVENPDKIYIVLMNGTIDAFFSGGGVSFEEMMKRLPAMGFRRIEILKEPPPQYDTYDYVIDIITDPAQKLFGMANQVDLSHVMSGNSTFSDRYTASIGNFRFSGGLGYGYTDTPKNRSESATTYYATETRPEVALRQFNDSKNYGNAYTGNLMFSLNPCKKHSISTSVDFSLSDSKNMNMLRTDSIAGEQLITRRERLTVDAGNSNTVSTSVSYNYRINGEKGTLLNLNYSFSYSPGDRERTITDGYAADPTPDRWIEKQTVDNISHQVSLRYLTNFFSRKLRMNVGGTYSDASYQEQTPYAYTDRRTSRLSARAHLAYHPSKQFHLSANLTGQYLTPSNRHYGEQNGIVTDFKQEAFTLSPSLTAYSTFKLPSLVKPKKKEDGKEGGAAELIRVMGRGPGRNSSLNLSYRSQTNLPSMTMISPYYDPSNPYVISVGNPNLSKSQTHDFSLGFMPWIFGDNITVNFIGSYSFSNNDFSPVSYVDDQGRIVNTYTNDGRNRNWSVGMSSNHYKARVSLNAMYRETMTRSEGYESASKALSLSTRYTFKLAKFLNLNMSARYSDNWNSGAYGSRNPDKFGMSATLYAYNINILKTTFNFSVAANNLLRWKGSRSESFSNYDDYYTYSRSWNNVLPLSFSMGFTLGSFKAVNYGSRGAPGVMGGGMMPHNTIVY